MNASQCRIKLITLALLTLGEWGYAAPIGPSKEPAKKPAAIAQRRPTSQENSEKAPITAPTPGKELLEGENSKPENSKSEGAKSEVSKLNPEDPPSIKGIKKRGSAASSGSTQDENNLFEDEKGFLAGLDYPELQVVPRASERLQIEAQEERSTLIGNYWPVQISSLALIMAGLTASGKYIEKTPTDAQKSENKFASQMGLLVGGLLFAGTYYVDHVMAYSKVLPEIKKNSGKDKKSQLLRERLSEEALERPAKVAGMINNLSVWSTFILATYISAHSKQTMPSYSGLALGLSFLPWLIDNRIVTNWEKHQEYKRKIYAPISKIDFFIDTKTKRPVPLLGLVWNF